MKYPRLKLWWLCLAVAASALLLKLTLTVDTLLIMVVPLIFLGPVCGIVLDRRRKGNGVAGGIFAGILSGIAISTIMVLYVNREYHFFNWLDWTFSTCFFVILESYCGWHWGRVSRSWRWPIANKPTAACPDAIEVEIQQPEVT